jgi:hypothetical protein
MLTRLFALFGLLLCPVAIFAADAPAPAAATDAPAVEAPKAFETMGVELYLKKNIVAQRASNDDLAEYTKALQSAAEEYFTGKKDNWREDLDIVVAVKPGPLSRVWLVSRVFPEPDDRLSDLRDKLAAVPPPPVNGGPVAFCIHTQVAGGNLLPPSKLGSPPFPKEWSDALAKSGSTKPLAFDDMLVLVSAAPTTTTWQNISGPLLLGGFAVSVVVAVSYLTWRNKQRRRR